MVPGGQTEWRRNLVACAVVAMAGWIAAPGLHGQADGARWDTLTGGVLPGSEVRALDVDPTGGLWAAVRGAGVVYLTPEATGAEALAEAVATEGGLRRWTQSHGLLSDGVTRVLDVVDGRLATHAVPGGVSLAVGEPVAGLRWRSGTDGLDGAGGRPRVVFNATVSDDGAAPTLWLATTHGAAALSGEALNRWIAGDRRAPTPSDWWWVTSAGGLAVDVVHQVHVDGGGTVWFACRRGLGTLVPATDGDARVEVLFPDENIRSILAVPSGGLWFGTSAGGALEFRNGVWTRHLPGRNVQPVAVGADGAIWARSDGEGAWRYDGAAWRRVRATDGLPSDVVHDIAVGRDGSVWFATAAGLGRLRP